MAKPANRLSLLTAIGVAALFQLQGCSKPEPPLRDALVEFYEAFFNHSGKHWGPMEGPLISRCRRESADVLKLYRQDPDFRVRFECAHFINLGEIRSAAPALAQGIGADPDPSVVATSAAALAHLLRAYPRDETVRRSALAGAEAFCERFVAGKTGSGFLSMLHLAASLKDPALLPPLKKVARKVKNLDTFQHIVKTIADIGGPDALQALLALRGREKNHGRRACLEQAIRGMKSSGQEASAIRGRTDGS
jgi:hypothetical protein